MVDPAFGVNNFNTPKYYNESQSIANNIICILQGKPGFYPSIPELGMDIRSYLYRPFEEIKPNAIKGELVRQCSKFVKNVRDGSFDVNVVLYQEKPLLVFTIPVTVDQAPQRLSVGVTTNANGELSYVIQYDPEDNYIGIN